MGKGVWVLHWVYYAASALPPLPPIPRSATKLQRGAAGGLVRGGKLAVCGLDLALRCVLFGPHSVLKET